MGKVVADRTTAETQTPVILNPKTVDNYHDSATLGPNSLSQGDNIIFDDGIIEKIPGTTLANSDTVSAAGGMGLHRTYANDGTKTCLRLYNGTLKSGPSAFATTVLANLATNKRTPWIDIKGKAYGVNETDGIIRYNGKTALGYKTGIVGPYLRKKIAFFESDETWTTTDGGATSKAVFKADEWTGKSVTSFKLYCSAASVQEGEYATIPLNLGIFDNSKTSTDNDYISFDAFHDTWQNVNYIYVSFLTKGVNYNHYYRAKVYRRDLTTGDNQWTHLNIRKGAFETGAGTPDWTKVSAVDVGAVSNVSGACSIHFDKIYLKSDPPQPYQMKRALFNCEGANTDGNAETWTGTRCAVTNVSAHEGHSSRYVNGTAGGLSGSLICTLGTAVDLTKWPDGTSTSASDELVFNIASSDISVFNTTNPIVLDVGSDSSNYLKRTFTRLSAMGLTGDDTWTEVRVPRARISATGAGTFAWTNMAWISFTTSALTGAAKYVYIDDCKFEPANQSYSIADMETDETWTITGNGTANVKDPQGKGWVSEGTTCLKLWSANPGRWAESSAIKDFGGSDIDLSVWSDGSASTTDDYICLNVFHQDYKHIEYVEVQFDCNDLATFVDYYKYRITKDMFAEGGVTDNKGKEIRIQKKDFDKIGTTAGSGWDKIGAVRLIVYSNGGPNIGSVYLDNLIMRRRSGKTGRYYYKYNFKVDDIASACSETSDYIDVEGSKVSLRMMTSQDTRVTSRDLYRLGGAYPDTWMLVKTIGNNTDTIVVDDVNDENLVFPLGEEVPDGWINSVLCSNLAYDKDNDQALYWGDQTYRNRVYYSHTNFYHVVDETGYREFKDEVMAVVPWFGTNIIMYKNGAEKVNGPISSGQIVDLPVKHGPCSYYATGRPQGGFIPYVGWDNVYILDGVREIPIGDDVKGYFKARESYLSTVSIGSHRDCIYIACKDSTGTPTYNDTVLRCYLPTKSWSILPDWNVNMWSNWDKMDDYDVFYYIDSATGNIYSINSATWQFNTTNITSDIKTGWISNPLGEIRCHRVEFKAKGTASTTLRIAGYKNLSDSIVVSGNATLTTSWQTFRVGPKAWWDYMRGDHLRFGFYQTTQNAYFKLKDIVVYVELCSDRTITTANEVSMGVPV